jgi:hypothetical protein
MVLAHNGFLSFEFCFLGFVGSIDTASIYWVFGIYWGFYIYCVGETFWIHIDLFLTIKLLWLTPVRAGAATDDQIAQLI